MTITPHWWIWPIALTALVWVVGSYWPTTLAPKSTGNMVESLVISAGCTVLTAMIWIFVLAVRLMWFM